MPMPPRYRLSAKLLLAFLIAAILPVATAAGAFLTTFITQTNQVAEVIVKDKAMTLGLLFDSKRDKLARELERVSGENMVTVNLELGLDLAVSDYLAGVARAGEASGFAVYGKDGSLRAVAGERPVLDAGASDGLPAGETETRILDGQVRGGYLVAARRLVAGKGEELGFIRSFEPLESLASMFSSELSVPVLLLGADGKLGAVARKGEVIRPEGPADYSRSLDSGVSGSPVLGEDSAICFAPLYGRGPVPGAWLGASYPLELLGRGRAAGILAFALIGAGALAFSVLASLYFSRTITRPLKELAATAREISGGNFGKKATIELDDEIGELAEDFNTMSTRLHEQFEELRRTRSYLSNVVNSLSSALVAVDREGVVTEWNQAARAMTGLKPEDAIGMKVWEAIPMLAGSGDVLERAVVTRKPEAFPRRSDGPDPFSGDGSRYIDVSLFPLVNNCVEGAVYRFDDVTEIERKDRQLRQAQKMEMIGNLASGIAHDFNNVLQGIMGNASLLSVQFEEGGELDLVEAKYQVSTLLSISSHAKELVKQLMGLARREELALKDADLRAIVEGTLSICETSFDKAIEIERRLPGAAAPVHADPVLLEQVFLNVCVNAAHAMTIMRAPGAKLGGRLVVELKPFHAEESFVLMHPLSKRGDYWVVEISDTGVGMDSQTMEKVFNPFFTTKGKGQGTGLGLSTAYGITRQHGGFIDLYSSPGVGTAFRIYLPALKGAAPRFAGERRDAGFERGSGAVLIVDDEDSVRIVTGSMLAKAGYEPVLCSSAEEAVGALRARPDIVAAILDVSMPRIAGDEALRMVLAERRDLRILVATGFRMDPRVDLMLAGGAKAFLQKPFEIAELASILKSVIRGA